MNFKENLIHIYEKYALDRNSIRADDFKEHEREEFIRYLKREHKHSILEIGCGPGHDSKYFKDKRFKVYAIDISPRMIELCKQKGIRSEVLDCYELERLEEEFDAIYSMNCLLHIPKKDMAHILKLIAAKLRDDGLFYLGLWGGKDFEGILKEDNYEPKRFFSFYSPQNLLNTVQEYFVIEYYRRIKPWSDRLYNSLILRKK